MDNLDPDGIEEVVDFLTDGNVVNVGTLAAKSDRKSMLEGIFEEFPQ